MFFLDKRWINNVLVKDSHDLDINICHKAINGIHHDHERMKPWLCIIIHIIINIYCELSTGS